MLQATSNMSETSFEHEEARAGRREGEREGDAPLTRYAESALYAMSHTHR